MIQHMQINHMIHHSDKMKNKNHTVISMEQKKHLRKFNIHLWEKLNKFVIEGTYINIIKAIYNQHTGKIILNGENWKLCM